MKTSTLQKPTLTRFALLLFSLALAASAQATAYVSNASGNLSTTTIWTPNGTPGASDTVEIQSGHVVTNATSASILAGVVVDSGGKFSVGASQTLGWVTNGGTFQIGNNTSARTLTIAGSITNRGIINTASTSPTHSIIFSANSSWVGSGDISGVKANVTINTGMTLDISGITNALIFKTSFGTTTTVNGTLNVGSTVINQANSGATMTFASGSTLALNVGGTGEYTDANIGTLLSTGQLGSSLGTFALANGAVLSLNPINASSSTFTCNSTIQNQYGSTNNLGLYKPGTGTLILGGNNTFTGPVTLPNAGSTPAGWIQVASSTALGPDATNKTINLSSSTGPVVGGIQLVGGVTVNNKHITIGGRTPGTPPCLQNVSGSNIWNGNLTIANFGGGYYIQSDAGTLVLGGTIQNTVGSSTRGFTLQGAGNGIITGTLVDGSGTAITALSISGPGTWSLTGPNTFTGGATVNGGTLIVNGQSSPNSGTGSGAVAVNAGGTLSGNGRVGGNVTVASSATAILYPNTSGGGTLTLGGTLTFSSASSVAKFNLSTTAGGANDKVGLENQAVTITTGNPQITINSAGTLDYNDYVLIDAGSGTISGTFSTTPVFTGTTPKYSGQYSIVTSAHQVKLHYTPIALTVTAAANSKQYDGTSSAAATPTGNALSSGDVITSGETYDNANVGTTHVLTPATVVIKDSTQTVDETANYSITPATIATGVITQATPTISGVTASQSINYGTATVSLSGSVSAGGSAYATDGDTVSVTINGSTQPATISGGAGGFSVSFPTATIPPSPSAYTITYAYAGDGNLNAATDNTGTALTVTGLKVPNLNFTNAPGIARIITLAEIQAAGLASSQGSHNYSITVGATSNGGNVITNSAGTMIQYTNSPSFVNPSDSFTYTVTDGPVAGSGTVTLNFASVAGPAITPGTDVSGHAVISFHGIPGYSYHVQRATLLSPADWTNAAPVTLSPTGDGSYSWTNTISPADGFYRLSYP